MKILWIPHLSFQLGVRTRAEYFVEHLAKQHEVHVICWDTFSRKSSWERMNPVTYVKFLQYWVKVSNGIFAHHLPRLPSLNITPTKEVTGFNNLLFHWLVKKAVKEHKVDIVICSHGWYIHGLPPFGLPVPLVIDNFDWLTDVLAEKYYIKSQAILCVSKVMQEHALKYNKRAYYLPNGIDTTLFQQAEGEKVREEYKLGDSPVISLIGLTSSSSLYFIEAIKIASHQIKDLKCLLVGSGNLLHQIKQLVGNDSRFVFTGAIPYQQIPNFFAASSVGMYPVDKSPYYDAGCPIKVLEYTAAGKPIISPSLEELQRWNFPNLIFAEPTPEAYAEGICKAFQFKGKSFSSVVEPFEIGHLVKRLTDILNFVIAGGSTALKRGN